MLRKVGETGPSAAGQGLRDPWCGGVYRMGARGGRRRRRRGSGVPSCPGGRKERAEGGFCGEDGSWAAARGEAKLGCGLGRTKGKEMDGPRREKAKGWPKLNRSISRFFRGVLNWNLKGFQKFNFLVRLLNLF